MSTQKPLPEVRDLVSVGGNLRGHQMPERRLWALPEVIGWMKDELKDVEDDGYAPDAISPLQQAGVLFNSFVSGEDLSDPLPHEMRPYGDGVWELRTVHLRIFGYFPERGVFVITSMDSKQNCMKAGCYEEHRVRALEVSEALKMNGGVRLTGEIGDVL
ncbi:hypothetical protein KUV28_11615 [Ferrimonas balearica]|nr:hypothetical protein [Ferrimonas balearica]